MYRCTSKILLSIAAIGWLISCSSDGGEALPTYAIERKAYEEVLVIEGQTEAVNSVNIHCPPHVGGNINYIKNNESATRPMPRTTL